MSIFTHMRFRTTPMMYLGISERFNCMHALRLKWRENDRTAEVLFAYVCWVIVCMRYVPVPKSMVGKAARN